MFHAGSLEFGSLGKVRHWAWVLKVSVHRKAKSSPDFFGVPLGHVLVDSQAGPREQVEARTSSTVGSPQFVLSFPQGGGFEQAVVEGAAAVVHRAAFCQRASLYF